MRKAINDNPVVQIAVIGVLMVGVGLMLATSVLKKDAKKEDSTPSGADAVLAGTADTSSASAAPALPAPTESATAAPTAAPAPTASPSTLPTGEFTAGPGLPAAVVDAWKGGDAVVLLIVRNKGVDDKLVKGSVQGLSGDAGVSVFVAEAKDAARYSRITQGVGVSRVPALVVIRPQKLSGSVPKAQVSYGFRNSQGVLQAVEDALYSGRDNIPYHPG
jgi:hypothetical protein